MVGQRRRQQQQLVVLLSWMALPFGVVSSAWTNGRSDVVGFVSPQSKVSSPLLSLESRRLAVKHSSNKSTGRMGKRTVRFALEIDPSLSEDELAAALKDLYATDSAKFQRVVAQVEMEGRSTKPKFPDIDLSAVDPVPPEQLEDFKSKYISKEKLDWEHPEAQERVKKSRELQYTRWKWACDNMPTYVNMLRVAGHSDRTIRNMLDGTPMCFASPEAYLELRMGLKQLAADIEDELGWTNCNFVITGSSVPGFSQNPIKGFADLPSKITSATTSDVDICIVGDGIDRMMTRRLEEGMAEPRFCFPTTCSATTSATRFGCSDLSKFSKAIHAFNEKWADKLAGGLQFTFCEDDNSTPPWEARIDIDSI